MMYGSSLWVSTSGDNLNKGLVKKYRGGGGGGGWAGAERGWVMRGGS